MTVPWQTLVTWTSTMASPLPSPRGTEGVSEAVAWSSFQSRFRSSARWIPSSNVSEIKRDFTVKLCIIVICLCGPFWNPGRDPSYLVVTGFKLLWRIRKEHASWHQSCFAINLPLSTSDISGMLCNIIDTLYFFVRTKCHSSSMPLAHIWHCSKNDSVYKKLWLEIIALW